VLVISNAWRTEVKCSFPKVTTFTNTLRRKRQCQPWILNEFPGGRTTKLHLIIAHIVDTIPESLKPCIRLLTTCIQTVKTTSQLELRNAFAFAAKPDTSRIGTSGSRADCSALDGSKYTNLLHYMLHYTLGSPNVRICGFTCVLNVLPQWPFFSIFFRYPWPHLQRIPIFWLLSLFFKTKGGLWHHFAVCVSVYLPIIPELRVGSDRTEDTTSSTPCGSTWEDEIRVILATI
jgi:hypothetical protein